jgi:hypothetical protein
LAMKSMIKIVCSKLALLLHWFGSLACTDRMESRPLYLRRDTRRIRDPFTLARKLIFYKKNIVQTVVNNCQKEMSL